MIPQIVLISCVALTLVNAVITVGSFVLLRAWNKALTQQKREKKSLFN